MNSPKIVFEDDYLVAVDKEAGHLVHPADEPQPDDRVVMKELRDHLGQHVYLSHRLDRPTTGLLLLAKDRNSANALGLAFDNRKVKKVYQAIVVGHPTSDQWLCEEPIQKTPEAPLREASTRFRVLQRLPRNLSLIEARPHTGRYHQIRRHLLHSGYPIIGDFRYSGIETCLAQSAELGTQDQMLLRCHQLIFPHPHYGDPLSLTAPPHELFEKLLKNAR